MMTAQAEPASIFYPARLDVFDADYRRALRGSTLFGRAAGILFVCAIAAAIEVLRGAVPAWALLATGLLLALAIQRFLRAIRHRDRALRLLLHYERASARANGTETQSGNTGEEFRAEHIYERDLNLLGQNSLFGMLDTVRTGVGQRGLAKLLLGSDRANSREEILTRRAAVQELAPQNELREQIVLLGSTRFQQVSAAFFDRWLDAPAPHFHPSIRIGLFITTGLILLLAVLGIATVLPWDLLRPNLLCLFAIQGAICFRLRSHVLPVLESSSHLSSQMQLLRDGLALLQQQPFASARLRELQGTFATPGDAVRLIGTVQQQFSIVEQRTKEWFLLPSLVLCAGTHAAMSIAKWKLQNAQAMKRWLASWAEFEALNAVATFAYEHPGYAYPELLPDGTAIFEASALAHPLLPSGAVANDIALNGEKRLYLISGSNMAGKSTLLRSIGVNAVLANAGGPVRAAAARISPLTIGASIALTDSLAEGRSKFLAEVERLHAILQAARDVSAARVLFLIDEIFSGTNSVDRKVAAEAVARSLVANGAIGALSTHDLTLTEMVSSAELRAMNVHMASPDAADPLAFDYRLKPGVNESSSALAIVRMMGIEV